MTIRFTTLLFLLAFSLNSCQQDDTVVAPELNSSAKDLSGCDFSAPLDPNLSGQDLINALVYCFEPLQTYTYREARTYLYTDVDVLNGKLQCIYSGYEIEINPVSGQSVIDAALSQNINCEHSFPQSRGASQEPAKSDMFHIYPALDYINGDRSNKPFADVNDAQTIMWYLDRDEQTSIPTSNIDAWSENGSSTFEPREGVKGDIARGIFYFDLIYNNESDDAFFEQMKQTLLQWHLDDPVDNKELNRNNKIKQYQGNDNPFIIDADLAQRVYGN